MRPFMGKDFLLLNETARFLYHFYAADMPIIDYHCHIKPQSIAENHKYENITQLMLSGDHYKWRLMRLCGEDEKLIAHAGDHPGLDYEKFIAFARVLPRAIGNPIYHWTHMELRRYFDCELSLNPNTADEIWNLCNEKLKTEDLSARGIIKSSKVEVISTTDDPLDDLKWHKLIAEDKSFTTRVIPCFRPDNAVNIDKPGFMEYLNKLGETANINIRSLEDLQKALLARIEYFNSFGCRSADHGLEYIPYAPGASYFAPEIFDKALRDENLTAGEIDAFKTAMILFMGKEYVKRGWVMQLHYGALRNVNSTMYKKLGPDTGFDAIYAVECSQNIAKLLDKMDESGNLPKTILYSLNKNDDSILDVISGCFNDPGVTCKVQHGSAWWYNDTKEGMEAQLMGFASRGILGGFVGMLTDSRCLLSYSRHDYFRRILCNLIGYWSENGECTDELNYMAELVKDICYNNAKRYFGLD